MTIIPIRIACLISRSFYARPRDFPIVKLSGYNKKWSMLEGSKNPFSVVVMAHLKTRATRHDPEERLSWKSRLVRGLFERGFQRKDVVELFRFIDWLFALPPELEERFEEDLKRYQAEKKMRYVTTIERKATHRGQVAILERLIERRFGELPRKVSEHLRRSSPEELKLWADRVIDAATIDEIFVGS